MTKATDHLSLQNCFNLIQHGPGGEEKQDRKLNWIAERDYFTKLWLTHLLTFVFQGIAERSSAIQKPILLHCGIFSFFIRGWIKLQIHYLHSGSKVLQNAKKCIFVSFGNNSSHCVNLWFVCVVQPEVSHTQFLLLRTDNRVKGRSGGNSIGSQ